MSMLFRMRNADLLSVYVFLQLQIDIMLRACFCLWDRNPNQLRRDDEEREGKGFECSIQVRSSASIFSNLFLVCIFFCA